MRLYALTRRAQVVVDYVAMTTEGRIFENSVEKGKPFDIRVVSGDADSPASTIAGLNEGAQPQLAPAPAACADAARTQG